MIPVDVKIHGCPINRDEFLAIMKQVLAGQKPFVPNYPVCVECKMAENVCVYDKKMTCMGPVSRAGCGACCVCEGAVCWGCRGTVDDPNANAHKEVLEKYGLSVDEVMNKFNLYLNYSKPLEKKEEHKKS